MKKFFIQHAEKTLDQFFQIYPQPIPSDSQKQNCRLVAHRGVHTLHRENTLAAFRASLDYAIWGVELDVRWSRDGIPIVLHDATAGRVFARPDLNPSQMDFIHLKKELPEIPSLEEVVAVLGRQRHLMIEIKEVPNTYHYLEFLRTLQQLEPVKDFHLLALDPLLFKGFADYPPQCFLPVSEVNFRKLSEWALRNSVCGIAGHYFLLNDRLKSRHENKGQKIGTGFVNSKNLLFREIQRGVEWIFTDRAAELSRYLSS